MVTTRMMPRSSPTTSARTRYRWRIIDLVVGHGLKGLLLCKFGIALGVEIRLALAIGGLGLVEDSKKLFTLDCWSEGLVFQVFASGPAYCADNLAGLVNHGNRLAERRHRSN